MAQAWSSPSLTWLCSSFTGFFLRQTRSELSKAPSPFSPLYQPLHHECSKACSAIIPLLRWGKLRLSMSPKLSPGRISSGNIGTQIQVCAEPQLLTSTRLPGEGHAARDSPPPRSSPSVSPRSQEAARGCPTPEERGTCRATPRGDLGR